MSDFYQSFVKDMRTKYGSLATPGVSAVPMSGNTATMDAPPTRFTGRGPDNRFQKNEPAGVVHEGEQVINAEDVKAAGGPKRINSEVQKLKQLENRGVPGFAEGTSNSVVRGVQSSLDSAQNAISDQQAAVQARSDVGRTQGTGDLPGAVKTPDTDTNIPGTTTPPPGSPTADMGFGDITKNALQGLRDIQRTGGEAGKMAGEMAKTGLRGQQAADSTAQNLALAQSGAEGGAANAAQARLQRDQGIQTAGLEGQLAVDQAARSERATSMLANLGMQGLSMEESARQFDANFGLNQDQFKENVRQFGLDHALRVAESNVNVASKVANDMLAAGDIEGFVSAWAKAGITIDPTRLQDSQAQQDLGAALGNFGDYMTTNPNADLTDPTVMKDLSDAWTAMGKDPNTPEFTTWANNQISNRKTMADPVWGPISSMTDESLEALVLANDGDFATFNYKGIGGAAGVRMALAGAVLTGGVNIVDGEVNFENDAMKALFGNDIAGDEPAAEEFKFLDDMETADEIQAYADGKSLGLKKEDYNSLEDFRTAVKDAEKVEEPVNPDVPPVITTVKDIPVGANGTIVSTDIPQDVKNAATIAWEDNPNPSPEDAQRAAAAGVLGPISVASIPTGNLFPALVSPGGWVNIGATAFQVSDKTATGTDNVYLTRAGGGEVRYNKTSNKWMVDGGVVSFPIPDPTKMSEEDKGYLTEYMSIVNSGKDPGGVPPGTKTEDHFKEWLKERKSPSAPVGTYSRTGGSLT